MLCLATSGLRSDICGARHPSRQDFPLQREVVVVGQRRIELLVVAVGAHRSWERGVPSADPVQGDGIEVRAAPVWIREGAHWLRDADPDAPWRIVDRTVVEAANDVLVVEHAPAAAKTRLAVAGQVPGSPAAEAHVVIVSAACRLRARPGLRGRTLRAAHCRTASCCGPHDRPRA